MKRFFKEVSLEPQDGALGLKLDGRSVKTPAGAELVLPEGAFADAVAAEWAAQGEEILPSTMPLTRLANTVIDGVSTRRNDVASDIVAYGASDLVCYWAEEPQALVERQQEHWLPVLKWTLEELKADFITVKGVVSVSQDENAITEVAIEVNKLSDYGLAALHEMTTLTGSVLIALAVLRGGISAEAGWAAAHVDEAFQTDRWGPDEEAHARLAGREAAFMAAVRALKLLGVMAA